MAIAYLSASAAAMTSSTPGSGTITPSYDSLATGSDRVLLVFVTALRTSSSLNATVASATYNGVSMTVEQTASNGTATQRPDVSVLRLVNPATGSNTLSITFDNGFDSYVVHGAVYTGVDQTTPVDVKDGDTAISTTTFSALTVTTTGSNEHIVLGAGNQSGLKTYTPEGSGVERIETASGSHVNEDCNACLVDYAAPTAQAYSDDITLSSNGQLAGVMVALNPAAGGTPVSITPTLLRHP